MQKYTLQNDKLRIAISQKGAEWTSMYAIQEEKEYLWTADPTYWGRHSCILFPYIGKMWNNEMKIGDKRIEAHQHGFLRDLDFDLIEKTEAKAILKCQWSAGTFQKYPFMWAAHITYELIDNQVSITYDIENVDDYAIPFSLGCHPGFNVPLDSESKRSDYSLVFEKEEDAPSLTLSTEGYLDGQERNIFKNSNTIQLVDDLFDNDALIFKGLKSNHLSLVNKSGEKVWTFSYEGFSYMGIWSKNSKSPYVCIEPWVGVADKENADWDFAEKEGVITIQPGEKYSCVHRVELH